MQSFQRFADSLQENANLQRLRDQIQDLPRKWLSRADNQEEALEGKVHGESNYHFKFKLEGSGFSQASVLVASAENEPGGMPVPLKCRWKRRVGDLAVEIPRVSSNMYQISADDVGTSILLEAEPADTDDGHSGVMHGEIGPFELDTATRRSLDNFLGLGGTRFPVMQLRLPGEPAPAGSRQDLVIHVTTEGLRVSPVQGAKGGARETVCEYSTDYPRVIIHPLDANKFQLIMSETKTFHILALSRAARDLIVLTIRCFHAKKFLTHSGVLDELLPVQPPVPGAPSPATSDGRLDACIILERLTKELNRCTVQKETLDKVKRNTDMEKKELQAQLIETISGFTDVLQGLDQQLGDGPTGLAERVPLGRLQEQVREMMDSNKELQAEIERTRQQLQRYKEVRKADEQRIASKQPLPGSQAEVQQLREERDLLAGRLADLSTSSTNRQQRDEADQAHAGELKRLRQDVEALHNQKEKLRRKLEEQEKERQELQDNFLFVKGQLDKVQMKQAQAADWDGDGQKELQRYQQTLQTASEERARLASRVEAVLRDCEKEKAYHEQHLERVVTANAKIMEERDRAAREVERLSRLYVESVQQLQRQPGHHDPSGTLGSDEYDKPLVHEDELEELRRQILSLDDAIGKKEQENQSLKDRIRKLAVAER